MSTSRLDADEWARALLAQLTLDEKLSLLAGQSFWNNGLGRRGAGDRHGLVPGHGKRHGDCPAHQPCHDRCGN